MVNSKVARFLKVFQNYQNINRRFYELVPESKLNFRLTPKSDSILENLAHQINVQKSYLEIVKIGEGKFSDFYDPSLRQLSREKLFEIWDFLNQELISFLNSEVNLSKTVKVKWSFTPIPALSFFWALNDHEILHNGINITFLDLLGLPRFPELVSTWG